jgi:hypothetical protein
VETMNRMNDLVAWVIIVLVLAFTVIMLVLA